MTEEQTIKNLKPEFVEELCQELRKRFEQAKQSPVGNFHYNYDAHLQEVPSVDGFRRREVAGGKLTITLEW
jgi:hypothetical protein